jgi:hypothetical protein
MNQYAPPAPCKADMAVQRLESAHSPAARSCSADSPMPSLCYRTRARARVGATDRLTLESGINRRTYGTKTSKLTCRWRSMREEGRRSLLNTTSASPFLKSGRELNVFLVQGALASETLSTRRAGVQRPCARRRPRLRRRRATCCSPARQTACPARAPPGRPARRWQLLRGCW